MTVFSIPVLCGTLLAYLGSTFASLVPFPSTPIKLSTYFDNQAASIDGTTGNFNNNGSTYVAEYLPTGPWLFNGVTVIRLLCLISEVGAELSMFSMTSQLLGVQDMIMLLPMDRSWNFRMRPMSTNFTCFMPEMGWTVSANTVPMKPPNEFHTSSI